MMENKKTIAEFIQENNLTAIEVVGDLVLNLVSGDAIYGIDVDTSNLILGMQLVRTTDYIINNDILEYNTTSLDLNTTYMLS